MNYDILIETLGTVPSTCCFGECNTGKTLAVEAALSLYGQQDFARVKQMTYNKARRVCSR